MFVLANSSTEDTAIVPAELEAMGKFNDSLRAAGVLLSVDGLRVTAVEGRRLTYTAGDEPTVISGPFDVDGGQGTVAGWWVIKVNNVEEAVSWAKKIPFKVGQVEVRRIAEREDLEEMVAAAK